MSKLRKSAQNQECFVRLPNICNWDASTTVLAHLNGGGIGRKKEDLMGAFCCSSCHSWLDGGYANQGFKRDERDLAHLQGVIRTQEYWLKNNFITIK